MFNGYYDLIEKIKRNESFKSILGIKEYEKNDTDEDGISVNIPVNTTNVVTGDTLREIQSKTLSETKNFLAKTFGPMGSNTKIIKGGNSAEITSSYSKDGLKVLSNIINSAPIEASIVDELINLTRAVEKEVGDGTTSTVILSSCIFDKLRVIENELNIPPYQLCRYFQEVVNEIKEDILNHKQEMNPDMIYDIAMISTNGDKEVSENIKNIYSEYGMGVELSVGISNTSDSLLKVYDGLTITEGMSDPVYINNKNDNTAEIHNAHIYHFADPVDTMEMIALFEAILVHNIYEPLQNDEAPVPTVICCPKLSKDMSAALKKLANYLYQYDNQGAESAKPPILIITDVVASDEIIMDDIANLCGCKTISKYIDPEVYKKDVEAGVAATVDTVCDFAGIAELVVADAKKTKFINPQHMNDKDGNPDPVYTAMVNFLTNEIEQAKGTESDKTIGLYKKRLSALKANMVDYLVGGVTISDRDMKKDLVEDAVKNCKSASLYGAGFAANFEGLRSSYNILKNYVEETGYTKSSFVAKKQIAYAIFVSYFEISRILYSTVDLDDNFVCDTIKASIRDHAPYNISDGSLPIYNCIDKNYDGPKVLCSIMLDVNILETISKIITTMVTCNQCLLQSPMLNKY